MSCSTSPPDRPPPARVVPLLVLSLLLPAALLVAASPLHALGAGEQENGAGAPRPESARDAGGAEEVGGAEEAARFSKERLRMVDAQIAARGVTDPAVLRAMRSVPRHAFVPRDAVPAAYDDRPLRIGGGQTISQPYIVAFMTELLEPEAGDRVLEIGTGSGYQAAVLAEVVDEVYTIEIKEVLHRRAAEDLRRLGYENVRTRHGDGYFGWQEAAPFDGIMITAAVDHLPPPLLDQIADGGRMVIPLGDPYSLFGQTLVAVTRNGEDFRLREILAVRFVPMTGEALEGSAQESSR